jgi:hypothetical protein
MSEKPSKSVKRVPGFEVRLKPGGNRDVVRAAGVEVRDEWLRVSKPQRDELIGITNQHGHVLVEARTRPIKESN